MTASRHTDALGLDYWRTERCRIATTYSTPISPTIHTTSPTCSQASTPLASPALTSSPPLRPLSQTTDPSGIKPTNEYPAPREALSREESTPSQCPFEPTINPSIYCQIYQSRCDCAAHSSFAAACWDTRLLSPPLHRLGDRRHLAETWAEWHCCHEYLFYYPLPPKR